MVNIGILYAVTAGVSGVAIAVILNRVLSTEHKELIDKELVNLLAFFCIFCVVDMIWGVLTSREVIINRSIYTVFTYAFHLGAALSAFLWAGYVISYIKVNEKHGVLLDVCRCVVLVIQFMVLVSNIWTNKFFSIDAEANYHSYELRNFMFFIQFLYYVVLIVFSVSKIPGSRKEGDKEITRRYLSALVFSCVPLAFGFGQMLWPDASMYSLGFMLTAVLIYSINVSYERKEFLRMIYQDENNKLQEVLLGLANDYQAIYLVNLDTNDYQEFGVSGDYKDEISTQFVRTNDFFDDLEVNLTKVVAEQDRSEVARMLSKENIKRKLSTKTAFSFNYRLVVDGMERYYLCKIIRLTQKLETGNKVIIGIFDDDGRIRKEDERRRALEDAVTVAKNANRAKTEFLFNMSHDIRTPMNAIIGFTNLALSHADDKKYLTECLNKVSLSSEHLLSLINDVLDMSRIESGKMQIENKPASVSKGNDQIVSIVQELALAKNINFTSEIKNVDQEWIFCDQLHLNQIVLNILSNAVNYTNPGGEVEYIVEQVPFDDDRVTLVFTVRDTGIGMSEEFLSRIFDEFERENNTTMSTIQGTGLGMSIVKRLVDMMGGTIEIESAQGLGTTVVVAITFNIAQPCEEDEDDSDSICKLPEGCRVLLVDDNELNREIAVDMLKDLGVAYEEARDGIEAVETVQKYEPGYFDLILMDVQMPKMNGYEATKAIRNLNNPDIANIPIIAITANVFDEDKRDALDAGMNAHLSKPINISDLSKLMYPFLVSKK